MKTISKFRIGSFVSSEKLLIEPDKIIMLDDREPGFPRAVTKQEPDKVKLIKEIRPVSITRKALLKKLGFGLTDEGTYSKTDESGLWTFIYDTRSEVDCLIIIRYKLGSTGEWQRIVKQVLWLHELQNFWQDFTGEELG